MDQEFLSEALQKIGARRIDSVELEEIKKKVATIYDVLQAEKEEALDHPEGSLEKLKEVVYDVDDLLDDFATEASRRQSMTGNRVAQEVSLFFSPSNQVVNGFKMAYKAKAIRKRINEIKANGIPKFSGEERGFIGCVKDNISFEHEIVIGRVGDREKIIEFLLAPSYKENVSIISIVGSGGLGKTTLAKVVFDDEQVTDHFEKKLWVSLSYASDVKTIVKKILESAMVKMKEDIEEDDLKSQLGEVINRKICLLVLDDLWNDSNENWGQWKELEKFLMGGSSGSKLVVITRSNRVAEMVSRSQLHALQGLSKDESWSLFKHVYVALYEKEPEDSCRESIVDKCKGVPLVIKAIAGLFPYESRENEWLPDVNSILFMCYNHLPSRLKRCFAYCALFPKDHEIDVKTLIHLWIAQEFVVSPDSRAQCNLEDIGLQYFNNLKRRSFFHEVKKDEFGDVVSCKMHDLMHDLATSVAVKKLKISNSNNIDKKTRHVSMDFDRNSTKLYGAKKLRTLLLLNQSESSSQSQGKDYSSTCQAIFSSFSRLRVCDMHATGIPEVPHSISSAKNLRYLDFSKNLEIKRLPNSITELLNLQVLKVSGCSKLERLPEGIEKLTKLRHLYCNGCSNLTHMPRGIGKLSQLQTLSMFKVDWQGAGLNELSNLNNLTGSLEIEELEHVRDTASEIKEINMKKKKSLQILSLHWNYAADADFDEILMENIQPAPQLKKLKVNGYGGVRFPDWDFSLANIVDIEIINCKSCQDLPVLRRFTCLKKLKIKNLPDLMYIDNEGEIGYNDGNKTFFPSLKELNILKCPLLKQWWRRWPDSDSTNELPKFTCLSSLKISSCLQLNWLPSFQSLQSLELKKVSLQCLKQIMQADSSSSSSHDGLAKLKALKIKGIEELESLDTEVERLTSLEELQISDCTKLSELAKWMHQHISLRELIVSGCPRLKFWALVKHLSSFSRTEIISGDPIRHHQLYSLRKLSISGCPKLPEISFGNYKKRKLTGCFNSRPDSLEINKPHHLN